MPQYMLSEIASKLGMTLKGKDISISGLNTLEKAGPEELSFLANPKYIHFLQDTKAAAVIVSAEYADKVERALISDMPYRDFGRALAMFARPEGSFSGISPLAFIDSSAELGEGCTVYPFAYIGPRVKTGKACSIFPGVYIGEDSIIGQGSVIYANAVIMSAVEIGSNCVIQPGAVIGAEGFGFTRVGQSIQKIPQAGTVHIGDRVEVGCNTTIDRGALTPTTIGDDSKLDNLVQIGHNVTMGKQNLIVSQVGIAGSTNIGDFNTLAGQAGVSGHLKIGNNTVIGPQAGVAKDVPDNFNGSGHPLVDRQAYLRFMTIMPKLSEMYKTMKRMEKELNALKGQSAPEE